MGNILNRWIHTLNCCILDIVHILEQCITLYDGGGGRGYFQCKINVTNLGGDFLINFEELMRMTTKLFHIFVNTLEY